MMNLTVFDQGEVILFASWSPSAAEIACFLVAVVALVTLIALPIVGLFLLASRAIYLFSPATLIREIR
ncbi:hypothetical protein AWENTII_009434 [Aspergillus wentii]